MQECIERAAGGSSVERETGRMTTAIRRAARTTTSGAGREPLPALGGRTALPRGRAVLGAVLVAASAVGLLLAHQAATRPHQQLWLVATHDIRFGERISADDLALAPMHLYSATAGRAFHDGDGVVGRIARTPIASGDLIQRGAVAPSVAPTGAARRLALELSPAQALDGALVPGDRVDVLGTADSTEETTPLATGAVVASVSEPDGGLGSTDTVRLTLVVPDATTAQAIVGASLRGDVSLIAAADVGSAGGPDGGRRGH
jgi:hypothetical protein